MIAHAAITGQIPKTLQIQLAEISQRIMESLKQQGKVDF